MAYNITRRDHELLDKYEEEDVSLTIQLHDDHWTLNSGSKFLYNGPAAGLLDDIRAHRIPVDLLELLDGARVPWYEGCMIIELQDFREPLKAKEKRMPDEHPELTRVVLRPNSESLWAEICLLNQKAGGTWTDQDALEAEAKILAATAPPLCLVPDPHLGRVANSILRVSMPRTPAPLRPRKRKADESEADDRALARRAKILQFMNPQRNRSATPSYRLLETIQRIRQEGGPRRETTPVNTAAADPPMVDKHFISPRAIVTSVPPSQNASQPVTANATPVKVEPVQVTARATPNSAPTPTPVPPPRSSATPQLLAQPQRQIQPSPRPTSNSPHPATLNPDPSKLAPSPVQVTITASPRPPSQQPRPAQPVAAQARSGQGVAFSYVRQLPLIQQMPLQQVATHLQHYASYLKPLAHTSYAQMSKDEQALFQFIQQIKIIYQQKLNHQQQQQQQPQQQQAVPVTRAPTAQSVRVNGSPMVVAQPINGQSRSPMPNGVQQQQQSIAHTTGTAQQQNYASMAQQQQYQVQLLRHQQQQQQQLAAQGVANGGQTATSSPAPAQRQQQQPSHPQSQPQAQAQAQHQAQTGGQPSQAATTVHGQQQQQPQQPGQKQPHAPTQAQAHAHAQHPTFAQTQMTPQMMAYYHQFQQQQQQPGRTQMPVSGGYIWPAVNYQQRGVPIQYPGIAPPGTPQQVPVGVTKAGQGGAAQGR